MTVILWTFLGVLITFILFFTAIHLIMLEPLRSRVRKELRGMTKSEIERSVFRFEESYFNAIGMEAKEVKEFRAIIEQRDLKALAVEWNRLSGAFVRLERLG